MGQWSMGVSRGKKKALYLSTFSGTFFPDFFYKGHTNYVASPVSIPDVTVSQVTSKPVKKGIRT